MVNYREIKPFPVKRTVKSAKNGIKRRISLYDSLRLREAGRRREQRRREDARYKLVY